MKTLQLLSASLILAAAGSAFAGTDDGNVPNAYVLQTPNQVTAPAAKADSSETGKAAGANAGTDFLRQQSATSGN